jgi:hypothetical protein
VFTTTPNKPESDDLPVVGPALARLSVPLGSRTRLEWSTTTMAKLVSPEYDLDAFCKSVRGSDISSVMTSVSTEIGLARRVHRENTKSALPV